MSAYFETFVIYYVAWQEKEFNLRTMREKVVGDIGEEGLSVALKMFREKRLEREANGVNKTLYQVMKEAGEV